MSILAYKTTTDKRANQPGTIVQKYGEIYGNIARRQIEWSDLKASRVQNLIENRQQRKEVADAEKERKKLEKVAKKASNTVPNSTN